jgi:methyltransferase (TIGR00027 family)
LILVEHEEIRGMMSPIGLTSRWVAANRALETEAPNCLVEDHHARALAGEEGFALLAASQKVRPPALAGGPDPYLSIRTRFFDDALLRAVNERALRQVVVLAAGMDARAFRLTWPAGTTLFEVDRDEVVEQKETVLRRLGAQPTCRREVVRADLESDWIGPLLRAGLDEGQPIALLVEGLLMYLDAGAVAGLLASIQCLARPGSWLGTDLVGTEFLASPYLKPFLELLEQFGCPWRFGTDEPEQLLARYGWAATVVVPGEPEANYGRWPYPVAPRTAPGVPRSYLVTAERTQ